MTDHPSLAACGRAERTGRAACHGRRRLARAAGGRGRRAGGLGHDAHQPPVLDLRQRPGLHDLDRVADVRLVLLVVDVADGPPLDVLAVARMLDQPRNLDAAGLVHLVAGDDADLDAALSAVPLVSAACCPPSLSRSLLPGGLRLLLPAASSRSRWIVMMRAIVASWPCGSRWASPAGPSPTGTAGETGS